MRTLSVVALALVVVLGLAIPHPAAHAPSLGVTVQIGEAVVKPEPYKEYRYQMRGCESTWNDNAVNPLDLDGTASYGRYQFKPGTLYYFLNKYGLLSDIEETEIMNVIFDGELQEEVFKRMIVDPEVDLFWQFPDCHTKHYVLWTQEL